ncbi:X-Pro dipeptidyl-peptidase protein [Stemphylium lycopersici]|uniref:X-Pro dipeptidyl-peptidase protein n=1 Tax=Stemphylium lycopersici TaxID=183478 RepID=A0A364MS16_STELY|nr:x-pro dipeptidyl-peptidase [Stemphylium lycopersici]RAQ98791.1 X-Pro dipeptidyl-peptidase protein [Stemphylium lycopersici]RAR01445.1 X-Pro dipeptidyl-peptidase protein [Stemphylium lycopersici]
MSLISILKGSLHLAGIIHNPPISTGRSPGVVVIHPGGGVKEQVANDYAQRISQEGFVSVAFDALYQGTSEGLPRFLEDPDSRTSDVSAVVTYLQSLDNVDPYAIAVVGICAGGGYGIAAATVDHRIKAVAAVSLVNIGDSTRLGWMNTLNHTDALAVLDDAQARLQGTALSGNTTFVPFLPTPGPDTPRDLVDAWEYYRTPRGYYNTSQNIMDGSSTPLLMRFDAWQWVDRYLSQPTLLIAGTDADSRWQTDKVYERIQNTNPNVTRLLVPGGRHMDFYDREEYVGPALANITEFLNLHLSGRG